MDNLLNHLLAAKVTLHNRDSVQLITPYKISDTEVDFYWNTGPSRCMLTMDNIEILHDYGEVSRKSRRLDKVDLHFLKTYYPAEPCEPKPDENGHFYSWIAPNGDFYYCRYGDHDSTARTIYANLYDEVLSGYEAREELLKTWVRLSSPNYVFGRSDGDDYSITKAQKEIIESINETFGTEFYFEFRVVE